MRGFTNRLLAIVVSVALLCPIAVRAEGVTAVLSPQKIYVDGQPVTMLAYSISDNNYIRLRSLGKRLTSRSFTTLL
jgi:hypothetical protein